MDTMYWVLIGVVVLLIIYIILVVYRMSTQVMSMKAVTDDWKTKRAKELSYLRRTKVEIQNVDFVKAVDSGEELDYCHFQIVETDKDNQTRSLSMKGFPPNPYSPWPSWTYQEIKLD